MTEKYRLLLIEDDPLNIKVMQGIVRHHRHLESDTAADPISAKTKILNNPPYHVIIADIGADGINILKTARGRSPDTKVYIVAGFGDQNALMEAIKSGAFGYLHKPFRPEELNLALFNVTHHFQNLELAERLESENATLKQQLSHLETEHAALSSAKEALEKQLAGSKTDNPAGMDLHTAIANAAQKRTGQLNSYTIHRELNDLAKLLDEQQISPDEFHEIRRGILEKAYKIPIPLSSS